MAVFEVDVAGEPFAVPATAVAPGSPVVVTVRPNLRRIHVLAGDVLAALGKRREVAGRGRNESQDVTLAAAWMAAYGTPALVVVDAQWLNPRILRGVGVLAERAACDLWLVHRPPSDDAFARAVSRLRAATRVPADMPSPVVRHPGPPARPDLPTVPAVSFAVFADAVEHELSADEARAVAARFLERGRSHRERLATTGPGIDAIAAAVAEILDDAPKDNELVVAVKALQLAAWGMDLHVRVDFDRLLDSEERPTVSASSLDAAVVAYRQPYRVIACALTRAGAGVADIAGIAVTDVLDDGSAVTLAGEDVPLGGEASTALRAQLRLRADEGANDADRLLPVGVRTLAKAVIDASADLGIHLHGRRVERGAVPAQTWLKRLGITVSVLP